ncbi:DNA polymerase (B family) [Invertebrate iridescent virus 22]|uniref:DNA-directed DNA polymerase n=1 Tax=Invertebrate iridescent virus 22 TaxID=345198 RepID=S0BDY9_9VIRU|nr:DNA polymerase (B family) [Invertebrate iridescent virus 22]CCA64443.1 delta DNA polymerase B [Invertebrate iridescent virus 22]CCV01845.1 DNA polymerase (B family) [Invertebrate iridescent virus 22]
MVCNTKEIEYEFYAYSWHLDEEIQDETFIRAYGFDDQQKNICVSINGFQPFVWVELPTHINWKLGENKERLYLYFNQMFPNVKCTLKFCKKLYGANLKKKGDKYTFKLFPFLMCSSPSFKELKFNLPSKLKTPQRIMGLGNLKFHVHGQDACPRLQLTSKYDLPTAGWIKFKGIEVVCEEDKFTSCDREFLVDLRLCKTQGIKPKDLISRSVKTTIPKPLVLSFDLEVNSEDTITMPKASRPGDVVFQISCVFSRLGSNVYDKYLLSLGDPQKNIVGANILKYSTEQKLLMGFKDLVNEKNPNVVIGYNIFNFDIPYLMDRANHKSIYPVWSQQGFAKGKSGIQREIKWSSSAYKNQEFKFLDCEGRLYIDLLPVVQRDFKLNDYKLKTVSTHFIGETKDDLDPKSIFRCYREGIKTQMLIIVKVGKKHFKLVGVENEDNLKQQNFFDEVTDVFWVENAFSSIEYIRQKIKHLEDKNGHFKIKYCDLKYMVVNEAKLNLLQTKHRNSNNYLKIDNLSQKYMSICGKYCIQDSMLVSKLMDKLNVWYSLSEMAVICNVPMITLFTKGQQIKVYSNLYKFCLENKIIPEKDGYTVSENERYVGAYVFVPKPGLYINVVPFDFSALYPSLIIAYNIDYSSCAFDPNIPDELCHVMEWEDHISCKHDPKVIEKNRLTKLIDELTSKKKSDKALISKLRKQRSEITKSLNKNVMCEKRKYRFLKVTNQNPEFKGVLPTIVQSLLDARKETRKEISNLKNKLKEINNEQQKREIETTIDILNQRQLAYKISANSMYGITGVKAGMLPFMPVAMSITYKGREGVKQVSDILQKQYGGELVYGDTDSNYVSFQHKKFSITELWDYAIKVADEISKLFPPPMKLEFEEAVYTKFLILTKKRYMYQTALRDGTIKPEIGKKGVVLNRRDNSAFIRKTYENVVKIIFENTEDKDKLQSKVIKSLLTDVNAMFNHQCLVEDFIITKSTGDYGNLQPQYFLNEKGLHRATLGQYNVPFLTEEIKEEEGIQTPEEETNWYLDKLPAHIQLLEKIKRRGHSRNEGSRLEYVVVETDNLKDKLSAKNETVMYYNKNKGILNLDYLYYLHRLINPIDQILEVIFNLNDFMKNHYNYRVLKKKLTIEMNELFSPIYNIEKDWLYLLKVKEKYSLIYGSKDYCKSRLLSQEVVYKTKYVPTQPIDFYAFLKIKYGLTTSLKTQFIFKDNIILLGNMTESKLIAVIKKECK